MIRALIYLAQAGAFESKRDYLPALRELRDRDRAELERNPPLRQYMAHELGCYMLGEAGILLLDWKLAPSDEIARQLHDTIENRIGDPRGLAWGASGTTLAALFMHEWTGEPRWQHLFFRHCDALWNQCQYDDDLRCFLRTHDLYRVTEKEIGALDGFAGTVFPLIRGRYLLADDRVAELVRRVVQALNTTVLCEDGFSNWPNIPEHHRRPSRCRYSYSTATARPESSTAWPIFQATKSRRYCSAPAP